MKVFKFGKPHEKTQIGKCTGICQYTSKYKKNWSICFYSFCLYLRIFISMGINGIVVPLCAVFSTTGNTIFIIQSIFVAPQGITIFLAFVLSPRTLKLIRKRIMNSKSEPRAKTLFVTSFQMKLWLLKHRTLCADTIFKHGTFSSKFRLKTYE